jgi:hypothetical protein
MTRRLALPVYCLYSFTLLFGVTPEAFAQLESSYSCLSNNNNYTYRDSVAYKSFLENTAQANTGVLDKPIQKAYYKIINDKNTAVLKQLRDKSFLFDTVAYPYLLAVFNNILDKNGLDRGRFHFFIDRTSGINAYSYEDGTIVCNLGLLTIIENESQLTMVFCHELGHYLLKHVNNSVTARLVKYNSPDFLARVKKIKSRQYNSKSQLEGMMMDDVFDRTRHGRSQERAADSLGILLFRNTGYNGQTVSRVFDVLDCSANGTTFCSVIDFLKNEGLDADETWFKTTPKMSFGGAVKKEMADSLKTHPDCPERKIAMQAYFG